MQILGVSDWIDPYIYSEHMKVRMKDVSFVISCGDISMSYLDFIMSELNTPLFYVSGNHDIKKNEISLTGTSCRIDDECCFNNLHLRFYKYDNLLITGFHGSLWYNGGPYQYKQWQVYLNLLRLFPRLLFNKLKYGKYLDIFVAHASPFGVGDKEDLCHIGFKAFNWFIKLFKPKIFIHGHIHIYDRNASRVIDYNGTKVVNCSGFYKLNIEL